MKKLSLLKKSLFLAILLLISSLTYGQQPNNSIEEEVEFECVECVIKYFDGSDISVKLTIPTFSLIRVPLGGSLGFTSRIVDYDKVRYGKHCTPPLGIEVKKKVPVECLQHKAKFTITNGNNHASFSPFNPGNLLNTIDKDYNFKVRQVNFGASGNKIHEWENDPAILFTNPNARVGTIIKINLDIVDNALPPFHGLNTVEGECKDKDITGHKKWMVAFDNNTPTALKKMFTRYETATAPNFGDEYYNMVNTTPTGPNFQYPVVDYDYKAVIACPNQTGNFAGHLVIESFTNSQPLYALEDLQWAWRMANNIMFVNEAIPIIHGPVLSGQPAAFACDLNSQFTDSHGVASLITPNILGRDVFEPGTNSTKKGYSVSQEYRSANGLLLGAATIERVIIQAGDWFWYIKKDHSNQICAP